MVELVPWGRLGMEFNEAFVKEIKRIAKLRAEVQVRSRGKVTVGVKGEDKLGTAVL